MFLLLNDPTAARCYWFRAGPISVYSNALVLAVVAHLTTGANQFVVYSDVV